MTDTEEGPRKTKLSTCVGLGTVSVTGLCHPDSAVSKQQVSSAGLRT